MTTECTIKPKSGSEQRSPLASGSVREHLFRGAVGLTAAILAIVLWKAQETRRRFTTPSKHRAPATLLPSARLSSKRWQLSRPQPAAKSNIH
jgi:hypothetical protein